jgi:hypothetical protein
LAQVVLKHHKDTPDGKVFKGSGVLALINYTCSDQDIPRQWSDKLRIETKISNLELARISSDKDTAEYIGKTEDDIYLKANVFPEKDMIVIFHGEKILIR